MMRTILGQLDNDQAILLMYLANELPATDRATVEKRLAAEPALHAELDALAAAQRQVDEALKMIDATDALPLSSEASHRNLVQRIRQWQADRLRCPALAGNDAPRRSAWIWLAPLSAAALLLISWGIWWGIQPDKDLSVATASPTELAASPTTSSADELADDPFAGDNDQADVFADVPADSDLMLDGSREYASIADGLEDLKTLSELTSLP